MADAPRRGDAALVLNPIPQYHEMISRTFLGWHEPALRLAAAHLADHYARAGELRMTNATVALPGARAGRRLKELLLDAADERGLRLLPPRVVTVGHLPELLYTPALPVAEPALCRRVWMQALRELPAELRARLFPAPPASADLRGWMALARVMEDLHTEVAGAGLRFGDVAELCSEGLLFCDDGRWRALDAAQRDYETVLRGLGYADRELERIAAVHRGDARLDAELWLLGIAELPRLARRMLAAADSEHPVRALIHAPEAEADAFDDFGCVVPEAWLHRAVPIADAQLAVRDKPADQAREVVRALAAAGDRFAADEITIAAPDAEVKPFLERALGDAAVPLRDAEGTPAERTPPFRFLAAVARRLDGGFPELAALVRHPDVEQWLSSRAEESGSETGEDDGDPAWIAALDHFFNRHLPTEFGARQEDGDRDSAGAAATLRLLHERLDGDLLAGMRGVQPSAVWCELVVELLLRLYERRSLTRSDPAQRRTVVGCERIAAAAAAMRQLPAAVDEPCGVSTALDLILDEAAAEAIPAEADGAAVELLGWLELHLDDAPLCIITGLNEPFLPRSVSAHAFLPNALRTRLGLVDNDRRYARDAYQLSAILASRPTVRLIAGRRTALGDPLHPSRLLLATEGPALARRVQRFCGADREPDRAGAEPLPASPAEAASPPSGFSLPPERVLSGRLPTHRIRVTAFRQLLQDPYGYALSQILAPGLLNDEARELDALAFGTLAHEVLRAFGGSDAVHLTDPGALITELDSLLDREAARRFGARVMPAVSVQIEQLRARLHAFARWHAAWISDGWRVVGIECGTPEDGAAFEVDGVPIALSARIDRIDHHPESGEWALFDYKTSAKSDPPEKTHRKKLDDALEWIDLQLPLYHHLAPAVRERRWAGGAFRERGSDPARVHLALR